MAVYQLIAALDWVLEWHIPLAVQLSSAPFRLNAPLVLGSATPHLTVKGEAGLDVINLPILWMN